MTEELITAILPWAKEHQEAAYLATLQVAKNPGKFARYVGRLAEMRIAADPEWWNAAPLRLLEHTSLTRTYRHRGTGHTFTVSGRHAKGKRAWGFAELADMYEREDDIGPLLFAKHTLDLVLDDAD